MGRHVSQFCSSFRIGCIFAGHAEAEGVHSRKSSSLPLFPSHAPSFSRGRRYKELLAIFLETTRTHKDNSHLFFPSCFGAKDSDLCPPELEFSERPGIRELIPYHVKNIFAPAVSPTGMCHCVHPLPNNLLV